MHGSDYYRVVVYDQARARRASAAKNRKCSYCGEGGHTKPTCAKMKGAMEAFRAKNVEYRQVFLDALIESGIGPGAMIKFERWGSPYTAMITSIDWAAVNMVEKGEDVVCFVNVHSIVNAGNPGLHSRTRLSKDVSGYTYGPQYEIVVPSNEKHIRASMPVSFLGGSLGLKEVFKKKSLGLQTMKGHYGSYDDAFDPAAHNTSLR